MVPCKGAALKACKSTALGATIIKIGASACQPDTYCDIALCSARASMHDPAIGTHKQLSGMHCVPLRDTSVMASAVLALLLAAAAVTTIYICASTAGPQQLAQASERAAHNWPTTFTCCTF